MNRFDREFEPQERSSVMRDTSEEAFAAIRGSGLLSRQRFVVYEHLYRHGPATAREIERDLGGIDYHKRLSELRDLGVVQEIGERECSVTGRRVLAWDVTSALPLVPVEPVATKPSRALLWLATADFERAVRSAGCMHPGAVEDTLRWLRKLSGKR